MKPDPDFAEYHSRLVASYQSRNYDSSLAGYFMRRSHQLCERNLGPDAYFPQVLEVGSGGGQHLPFVRHRFDAYHLTDLSTAMLHEARDSYPEALREKVVISKEDAGALSFADASFDRLIATHILEHLPDPHRVLREWDRVVRPGGLISIVLPCDPGLAWRFGRALGPRRHAERSGIEYDYWMAREHINGIGNLVTLIRYYFANVQATWFPARLPSVDLNLFFICQIHKR